MVETEGAGTAKKAASRFNKVARLIHYTAFTSIIAGLILMIVRKADLKYIVITGISLVYSQVPLYKFLPLGYDIAFLPASIGILLLVIHEEYLGQIFLTIAGVIFAISRK